MNCFDEFFGIVAAIGKELITRHHRSRAVEKHDISIEEKVEESRRNTGSEA